MTQQSVTPQTVNKPITPAFNQAAQPFPLKQPITEERVKELVVETLITLDLIPKTQKNKAITLG
ncbi:MAG: hypothetical protein ACQCN4_13685 [Candidatus Bathyarchaeia archaeon]